MFRFVIMFENNERFVKTNDCKFAFATKIPISRVRFVSTTGRFKRYQTTVVLLIHSCLKCTIILFEILIYEKVHNIPTISYSSNALVVFPRLNTNKECSHIIDIAIDSR